MLVKWNYSCYPTNIIHSSIGMWIAPKSYSIPEFTFRVWPTNNMVKILETNHLIIECTILYWNYKSLLIKEHMIYISEPSSIITHWYTCITNKGSWWHRDQFLCRLLGNGLFITWCMEGVQIWIEQPTHKPRGPSGRHELLSHITTTCQSI